jgi:hypothetical protein
MDKKEEKKFPVVIMVVCFQGKKNEEGNYYTISKMEELLEFTVHLGSILLTLSASFVLQLLLFFHRRRYVLDQSRSGFAQESLQGSDFSD